MKFDFSSALNNLIVTSLMDNFRLSLSEIFLLLLSAYQLRIRRELTRTSLEKNLL